MAKIKVGIVGGTGYTGVELLRLLANHPDVSLAVITSRSESGLPVKDLFPNLRDHLDIAFSEPDAATLKQCDLVFFATPNGIAMKMVPELIEAGVKVIDLAADFRIKDINVWQQWYGMEHACPDYVAQAVYGLPEVNREAIKTASLIANPGCYPTAVQLGFLPLLENGLLKTDFLVADCKSGVSGAGRGANVGTLLCETSESFKAYAVPGHRHLPEISQGLDIFNTGEDKSAVDLTFVPHLVPMIRGIQATLYGKINSSDMSLADLQQLFETRYANEPFVDVLPSGAHPETRTVKGSNMCRIAIHQPQDKDTIVILSVIDNLVKGAAGQAVQNMNLAFGLDEKAGLNIVPLMP
ncbi:N-acetyl-gamma-glutamyl-phosphate reductase [sulfur-oxidizing endosymbiont of Gigantopelta aegis]|uniref:N-acetyl-gamma-glutamyl-phosphate reductase n=1 Tax=sulfur-oxidizing endosymbiont of Gigantopelta aegis TaxID=2794934 RepID=UPI0018DDAA05|nr:N-acetyl-gamma-glutamyl-phosphate reductase [sulfur-oxidizing endosymbiont of Gigantopelta aegis]